MSPRCPPPPPLQSEPGRVVRLRRGTGEGAGERGVSARERAERVCGACERACVCVCEWRSGCERVCVCGAEEERALEGWGAGGRRLGSPGCALARSLGTSFMPQEP